MLVATGSEFKVIIENGLLRTHSIRWPAHRTWGFVEDTALQCGRLAGKVA